MRRFGVWSTFCIFHFINRFRKAHIRFPKHCTVVTRPVPQLLPHQRVIARIKETSFAVATKPRGLAILDGATVLARSTFGHPYYPLLLRRAGGRLSGVESSER